MSAVLVIGMHRSGTSAVTRVVNLLGVPIASEAEGFRAASANPTGFWEPRSLTQLNEEILGTLGGTWSQPPAMPAGWETDERLAHLKAEALQTFEAAHGRRPSVWKDPRNALVLPFWLEILAEEPVILITQRNPLSVWRSLAERDKFSKALAVALWERYTRAALANAASHRVFVVHYERLVDDPSGEVRRIADFLAQTHVIGASAAPSITDFVDPALRHEAFSIRDVESDPEISPEQLALYAATVDLAGAHPRLEQLALPPETSSTELILSERRAASQEVPAVRAKLRRTRRKLERARARDAASREEVARLRGRVAELERKLADARDQIAHLRGAS